eukprot:COSAG02_NODE_1414_length_12746_cov_3.904698_6_plen_150_part_00
MGGKAWRRAALSRQVKKEDTLLGHCLNQFWGPGRGFLTRLCSRIGQVLVPVGVLCILLFTNSTVCSYHVDRLTASSSRRRPLSCSRRSDAARAPLRDAEGVRGGEVQFQVREFFEPLRFRILRGGAARESGGVTHLVQRDNFAHRSTVQ